VVVLAPLTLLNILLSLVVVVVVQTGVVVAVQVDTVRVLAAKTLVAVQVPNLLWQ
jgi:hypothetical protein